MQTTVTDGDKFLAVKRLRQRILDQLEFWHHKIRVPGLLHGIVFCCPTFGTTLACAGKNRQTGPQHRNMLAKHCKGKN